MSPEEKQPFLGRDTDSESDSGPSTHDARLDVTGKHNFCRTGHRIFHPLVSGVVFSVAIIFLVMNVGVLVHLTRKEVNSPKHPYSPADVAIGHNLQDIHKYEKDDPFVGPPSREFDQAWSDLLHPFNIHVSATEMRKANAQSFRLESDKVHDESYLGYLEVYHQLHCVKMMVQIRNPEHYPDLVAAGMLTETHFQHCLQALQHTIMCHADTSLSTWKWDGNASIFDSGDELTTSSPHVVGAPVGKRQCVDWKRLDDWARARSLRFDYRLRRPDEEGYFGPELDDVPDSVDAP